jgi:hypothetical protein
LLFSTVPSTSRATSLKSAVRPGLRSTLAGLQKEKGQGRKLTPHVNRWARPFQCAARIRPLGTGSVDSQREARLTY